MSPPPNKIAASGMYFPSPSTDWRGQQQRPDQRPRPAGGHHPPQGVCPPAEHLVGHQRHQHGIRHADQAHQRQQQQDAADRPRAADVVPPLGQVVQDVPLGGSHARPGCHPHRHQRGEHGEVADRVDQKTPPFAEGGDQDPADRRSHQPGRIDHRRIQGDRVGEVVFVVDQFREQGLPRRHVEGVDQALAEAQHDDLSDRDPAPQRQHGHGQGLQHGEHLGEDQQVVAIPAIDEHAGERGEKERGKLPGKAHHAEHQRRAGQAIDQPPGGDPRHPGADQREALAVEEQAEIPMRQRPPHRGKLRGGRGDGRVGGRLGRRGRLHGKGRHGSVSGPCLPRAPTGLRAAPGDRRFAASSG